MTLSPCCNRLVEVKTASPIDNKMTKTEYVNPSYIMRMVQSSYTGREEIPASKNRQEARTEITFFNGDKLKIAGSAEENAKRFNEPCCGSLFNVLV